MVWDDDNPFEAEIEDQDDEYVWAEVELCEWCGYEFPPGYDDEDEFECRCGNIRYIPDWLAERMEEESYGKPDRDKGGRLDWGPPGRYRAFPARSGFPFDFWRGHDYHPTHDAIAGIWHLFDK